MTTETAEREPLVLVTEIEQDDGVHEATGLMMVCRVRVVTDMRDEDPDWQRLSPRDFATLEEWIQERHDVDVAIESLSAADRTRVEAWQKANPMPEDYDDITRWLQSALESVKLGGYNGHGEDSVAA